MDTAALIDDVTDDKQTELSRLGSSKTLYADTRGEMDEATVFAAAAAREAAASETFAAWADDESHEEAAVLFADAAEAAESRLASLDADPADWTPAMHDTLDDQAGTVARLGGLLAWTLVDKKVKEQLTGFFTGQADPQTASTFRSAGSDVVDLREDAGDLLDTVCEGEDDWERARESATAVVEAAYDEFFETLESLGVNPKPVC
jgi:hypothetical protein